MLELFTTLLLLRKDTRGVTALEYGLIAAVMAAVIIAAFGLLGTDLSSLFTSLSSKMSVS